MPVDINDVSIETGTAETTITPPAAYQEGSRLRYRPVGATSWVELELQDSDAYIIRGLDGLQPYEYEISYACSEGLDAPYSQRGIFDFCPYQITYSEDVTAAVQLQAEQHVYLSSLVEPTGDLYVSTGSCTFIQSDFTVYPGSSIEIHQGGCED